jgi:hypothetical protein
VTVKIDTLAADIQGALGSERGRELAKEVGIQIGALVATKMEKALSRVDRARKPNVLFPSELGHPCDRKTWYDFHYDPKTMPPKEGLDGATRIKFTYGDLIEAMIIPLIHVAGHKVEGVNKRVEWHVPDPHHELKNDWQVNGYIDVIVNGVVMDVKSMNGRSFDSWSMNPTAADKFGYAYQLASYHVQEDGDDPQILAINKENGRVKTFSVPIPDAQTRALRKALAVESPAAGLLRLAPVEHTKGNKKLCVTCSYCSYKAACWSGANGGKGLRKFIYSNGPVWLTEVGNVPNVTEVPL